MTIDLAALVAGVLLIAVGVLLAVCLRPRLTVATLYNSIWGALLLVQGLVTPVAGGLPLMVVGAIVLGAVSTVVGTVSVQVWRKRSAAQPASEPLLIQGAVLAGLVRGHLVLIALLVGYMFAQVMAMWPAMEQAGGFIALFTPGSGAARELKGLLALSANSGEPFSGSLWAAALSYVLFMGNAALFTGGIFAAIGRWWLALIPLGLNALFSVITFQRTSFIVAALLMAAAWILSWPLVRRRVETSSSVDATLRRRTRHGPRLRIFGWVAAGLAAVAVLLIPIQLRNSTTSESSGLLSLGQYVYGSIAGMAARVTADGRSFVPPVFNGEWAPTPGLGAYTFTKALGALAKLGIPTTEVPYVYDYYTTVILGQPFSTNTATLLYDFILDGDGWWLAGFLAVFAIIATWCQTTPDSNHRLMVMPVVAYAFATIAWSFFVGTLLRDTRNLLVAVVASVLLAVLIRSASRSNAAQSRQVDQEPQTDQEPSAAR